MLPPVPVAAEWTIEFASRVSRNVQTGANCIPRGHSRQVKVSAFGTTNALVDANARSGRRSATRRKPSNPGSLPRRRWGMWTIGINGR